MSPRILFVNGFTEFDRFNNPRQTPDRTNYVAPSAMGKMDRVIPRLNNAFDYVVQHGKAVAANGAAFDSCEREAVAKGTVPLENYEAVIWAAGKQRTEIFRPTEQRALASYLNRGGNLFVSGAYIAETLQSSSNDIPNLHRELRAVRASSLASSPFFTFLPAKDSIFRRNDAGLVDSGKQTYFCDEVSRLAAIGIGSMESLRYADDSVAAVQYDGSAGGGKAVFFGFPFETIASARTRIDYMADVLRFFDFYSLPGRIIDPQVVWDKNGAQISWRSKPGRKYQVQYQSVPGGVLWLNLSTPIVASGLSLFQSDDARREKPRYRVVTAR
jgi:hypothetical protein